MKVHVKAFLDFLGQELSESAINDIAEIIITNYGHYSDMVLKEAFLRIKSGKYEKEFGKITGLMITQLFNKFDAEYTEEISQYRQAQSHNAKHTTAHVDLIVNPITYDDKVKNAYAMLKNDLYKIGQKQEQRLNEPIRINAPSDIIHDWIKEFDDLYKSTGNLNGIKSIKYEGVRMSLPDFLEYKRKMFEQLSE